MLLGLALAALTLPLVYLQLSYLPAFSEVFPELNGLSRWDLRSRNRFLGTPASGWAITPDISSYVDRLLADWRVHGLSVGVVRLTDDGEIHTDLGSWGTMSEEGEPAAVDTLFNIGTCSKSFLPGSMAVLIDDFAHARNITPLRQDSIPLRGTLAYANYSPFIRNGYYKTLLRKNA